MYITINILSKITSWQSAVSEAVDICTTSVDIKTTRVVESLVVGTFRPGQRH